MLPRFQEIQQQRLNTLGDARKTLNQKLLRAEHNLIQLHQYQQTLSTDNDDTARIDNFSLQNQQSMKNQIGNMIGLARQERDSTRGELEQQTWLIKQQLCQIKSIDLVIDKRASRQAAEQDLQEQVQQDELAMQAYVLRLAGV